MAVIDTEARELKSYIFENKYVEQILESIDCRHIKYHAVNNYWTACNPDGDNKNAIVIYDNEFLNCVNYTRKMVSVNRSTDILDLVCFCKNLTFPEGLKFICNQIGISYYHDFNEDIPECFKILDMIEKMKTGIEEEKEEQLKPISENVLSYYRPWVNDMFRDDNISYHTQKDFEIGYDEETNRITIPIRSEIGDLVGVKGRLFKKKLDDFDLKYIYLEPCPRGRILYGLYKTMPYILRSRRVYILEAEKSVMQCWNMGYKNCVGTGGKKLSQSQIDMLVRLGVKLCFCFDKDVQKEEIESIVLRLPDGFPAYCMLDKDNILDEKESPSDERSKWLQMVKNNIYRIK